MTPPPRFKSPRYLRNRDQLKLAVESLAKIPQSHPMFLEGEITRADILREDDKSDAAVEALQNLTRTHPDTPRVYMSLAMFIVWKNGIKRRMMPIMKPKRRF